jgi:hypothetical protein
MDHVNMRNRSGIISETRKNGSILSQNHFCLILYINSESIFLVFVSRKLQYIMLLSHAVGSDLKMLEYLEDKGDSDM